MKIAESGILRFEIHSILSTGKRGKLHQQWKECTVFPV